LSERADAVFAGFCVVIGQRSATRPTALIIIGAGGHGSELEAYLPDVAPAVELVGFVDENKGAAPRGDSRILGGFGDLDSLLSQRPDSLFHYITAVGSNDVRRRWVRRLEELRPQNLSPWILRHPTAIVGADVRIGEGTCLAPGCILTTKVTIGSHCIVNVSASVSHDCVVGDFVNINPGAVVCGNVQIGEGAYIGAGATVIEKVSIGDWAIVGAGAVVIGDIPPFATAVGVPARVIKRSTPPGVEV